MIRFDVDMMETFIIYYYREVSIGINGSELIYYFKIKVIIHYVTGDSKFMIKQVIERHQILNAIYAIYVLVSFSYHLMSKTNNPYDIFYIVDYIYR